MISTIDIIIIFAISKARLFLKLISRFDEECKKIQMKIKRLKKIWKKEKIEKS